MDVSAQAEPPQTVAAHDGAHDFDREIGLWDTNVRVHAPLDANGVD
ncbi:MAG: hypothetical protein ACT4OF_15175 [Caulobacteraceae bacterium]